ncbi:MAG: MFS transporter [Haloferacaceae archaeon]
MDRRHWGLAALMGGIHFTFHLFLRLIPPLIPVLAVVLGYPLWKLGLLVSGYFAGSSLFLLPMGVLSDRYDRRAVLSGALAVVGAGYVLLSFAPALGAGLPTTVVAGRHLDGPFAVMIAATLVSGAGTSAHVPVGVPLLTSNASDEARGRILGVWGGGSKLGDAAGPALVGVLVLAFGWRSILLGFGVLGLVGGALLFVVLGATDLDTRPPTDRTGGEGTGAAEESWPTDRRRYLYPLLALVGYFAAYNVVVQGAVTFVPTFVADVYGYTVTLGGLVVAPESFADFALSVLLVAAAGGRFAGGALVDRYEHRRVLCGSLAVAAVAVLAFAVLPLGPGALVAVLVVLGVCLWGNSPARDSLVSDLTPDGREGRTFSYLWTASRVFGALSPAAIGLLSETAGIRRSFSYLAAATVVAALFVALLFDDRVYVETGAATDD